MSATPMPTEREIELLLRLADGSLPRWERDAAERELGADPLNRERLRRHREVVTTLRSAQLRAPDSLRRSVEATYAARRPRRLTAWRSHRPRSAWLRPALTAAAAALVAGFAIARLTATDGGVTIADVAAFGARASVGPPPPARAENPALLDEELGGVAFPNWEGKLDWRATGERSDGLDGRRAETIFYEHGGQTVAYTILSGAPLEQPSDARRVVRNGLKLHLVRNDRRAVVAFQRGGRTCVLSGAGIRARDLLDLAAWKAGELEAQVASAQALRSRPLGPGINQSRTSATSATAAPPVKAIQ